MICVFFWWIYRFLVTNHIKKIYAKHIKLQNRLNNFVCMFERMKEHSDGIKELRKLNLFKGNRFWVHLNIISLLRFRRVVVFIFYHFSGSNSSLGSHGAQFYMWQSNVNKLVPLLSLCYTFANSVAFFSIASYNFSNLLSFIENISSLYTIRRP